MTGEYQIVHIAAHGQYDPDPMKSGVVISDRLFITPAEVARLPLVPELVFLNCCYLGTMGESRPSSPDPRLASSLAEGFIRAGARAVIAARWAVDDIAGTTFARTFYEEFLAGTTFRRRGEAGASGHARPAPLEHVGRLSVLRQPRLPLQGAQRTAGPRTRALARHARRVAAGPADACVERTQHERR